MAELFVGMSTQDIRHHRRHGAHLPKPVLMLAMLGCFLICMNHDDGSGLETATGQNQPKTQLWVNIFILESQTHLTCGRRCVCLRGERSRLVQIVVWSLQ